MNLPDNSFIYTLCYILLFGLTGLSKLNKSNRLFDTKGNPAKHTGSLMELHVAGIFWLGIVPCAMFNQSVKIIFFASGLPAFSWLLFFISILILIVGAGFGAGHKIQTVPNIYPAFSKQFLALYFPIRILFLCAYEIFFRGFLLFDGIKWAGILPAILLSTGLTVLLHVFTNKKEMWGCIPFGILLSICCIAFNAVWPAIVLHLALSLAYELPVAGQFLTQLKPIK
jgi:membrane protease YdiL (CAAX protease family)